MGKSTRVNEDSCRINRLLCKIKMNKIELARKYLHIFCESKEFDSLGALFDEHLDFQGPFYKFSSAFDYIDALKASPPVDVSYEIVEEFGNENSVCIIYKFSKRSKSTLMAQTFWFSSGRINKIRLIFNPKEIT